MITKQNISVQSIFNFQEKKETSTNFNTLYRFDIIILQKEVL